MKDRQDVYQETFLRRVEESQTERARVRQEVLTGHWQNAEPDPERREAFRQRIRACRPAAAPGAEVQIGDTLDYQPASFLDEGARIRRSVGKVSVNSRQGSADGSGFMVSPQLFLTNNHVLADIDEARNATVMFDYELDENGMPRPPSLYALDPDAFFLSARIEDLDFTLVAIGECRGGEACLPDLDHSVLSDQPDKHVIGMNVNIIQHPAGREKMVCVRNNLLVFRTENALLYETDTEPGSSGAPVYNDSWDLVALHHWGAPYRGKADAGGQAVPRNVNEGIRISAIYKRLQKALPDLPARQQTLLKEALSYRGSMATPGATARGKTLTPRPASARPQETSTGTRSEAVMDATTELKLHIPLEVTVRIGGVAAATVTAGATAPERGPALQRALTAGAEAVRVDLDYGNRTGYDAGFIPGFRVPLPKLSAKLAKQLGKLDADEPDAASGELRYEHFSVKLNRPKRMAIFTATNIDGDTWRSINRDTGEISDAAEGDRWFLDPRVNPRYYLDQTFYGAWSHLFDRGHLTRRTDPTWGDDDEARRANADTFHFTNCSPQHFRFNQTSKYWQGAERYVLENGLLASASKGRISVFQGPVFDDDEDLWADDVQIPSQFFKVIVWKSSKAARAVGLLVSQKELLGEERRNLGQPKALANVDVGQWRVPVSRIEGLTGLDFGAAVRKADTIKASGQPAVGAEALRPIRSFRDILS